MGKGQAGKKVAAGGLRLGPGGVLCCVCKRPPGRVCSVGFHTCGCVCAVGSARIRVDASAHPGRGSLSSPVGGVGPGGPNDCSSRSSAADPSAVYIGLYRSWAYKAEEVEYSYFHLKCRPVCLSGAGVSTVRQGRE